jgi:hypothetical protein
MTKTRKPNARRTKAAPPPTVPTPPGMFIHEIHTEGPARPGLWRVLIRDLTRDQVGWVVGMLTASILPPAPPPIVTQAAADCRPQSGATR